MGQSVNQLVTKEHFDLTVERLNAAIATLDAKIDTRVQALESTLRAEIMRAALIVVGVMIPGIGLMMAIMEFYSSRGTGA